ncbi:cytochrome ubiquinol oxidase subunit II [Sphingobium sp. B2]|uniref:cytochrome ubiquinol oxidase subunit II n=1 Tax=Sphingobium sp. B2 TaxID=2583228 RepID=UPI0021BD8F5C|nr:cytochrome ubiquinol oxidase subunit II [Sphingobium sp. B2]
MMTLASRIAASGPLLALGGCAAFKLGAMNAAGPIAEAEWNLYTVVAIVLIFVGGPVLLLAPIIAWHYRRSNTESAFRPEWNFAWPLEFLIWIPPTAIVAGLGILLWQSTHRLDPYRAISSSQSPMIIQAVALDWKWLFIYPDAHIATINRMPIPAGRPIRIELTSGTVMQSLFVPRLAGQVYAMAGMRTELNLAASKPGVYRGENSQYNGQGFARQKFDVVALPPADYQHWVERMQTQASAFDGADYDHLFKPSMLPKSAYYSAVPDGVFGRILDRSRMSIAAARR